MNDRKIDPIRKTDDPARQMARDLIENARFAALAVLEPGTGFPLASRIAVGIDKQGAMVTLASELSAHSKALAADPRCSVLAGEPGKGDPLAHPRITLIGAMTRIERNSAEAGSLRDRWLELHPKSALYIDFADFHFFRLELERAHLNCGFGKAYILTPKDLAYRVA
jgi:putative heme iron utilization protein